MTPQAFCDRVDAIDDSIALAVLTTQGAAQGSLIAAEVARRIRGGDVSDDYLMTAIGAVAECGGAVLRGFFREIGDLIRESKP